ncbi:MAG: alpha/beta fold hydrolase [Chitinivibrionales bacterium]|nr:alpha/beta fold hydrolase [Chitinivibrionales bacterium]
MNSGFSAYWKDILRMETGITALLLHGLGNTSRWWAPFIGPFRKRSIDIIAPDLPKIGPATPDDWLKMVHEILDSIPGRVVIAGHSLGSSVAVLAACRHSLAGAVFLALPVYKSGEIPSTPQQVSLEPAAGAAVARFVLKASRRVHSITCPAIHIAGDLDQVVSTSYARSILENMHVIQHTGHNLNESDECIALVTDTLIKF